MKSLTTPAFRKLFAQLPAEVRDQARAAYRLFVANPRHPSLNLKRIHGSTRLVSARVGRQYQVVALNADRPKSFGFGSDLTKRTRN